MTQGLFIEITKINRVSTYINSFEGILRVDGIGRIKFEVFRNPKDPSYLHLRVYNDDMSIIIKEFESLFFSSDYDNRKIISWIGEHSEELVTTRPNE